MNHIWSKWLHLISMPQFYVIINISIIFQTKQETTINIRLPLILAIENLLNCRLIMYPITLRSVKCVLKIFKVQHSCFCI